VDCRAKSGLSETRKTFVLRTGRPDSVLHRTKNRVPRGDITAGERITVQGTRKSDGTFTAQMIQIGGGPAGGGPAGGNPPPVPAAPTEATK